MTKQTSPNLIITVDKSKVKFDGDFAVIDVGLTLEEFIRVALGFASAPHETMAVKKEESE